MSSTSVLAHKATVAAALLRSIVREIPASLDVSPASESDRSFDVEDGSGLRGWLGDHGWVRVRNVLSSREVDALREGVLRSRAERLDEVDLLANPHLSWIITHPAVVRLANVVAAARPVYFGDSSWLASGARDQGFHKDNPGRSFPGSSDWKSPYTVFRMGFYLQDCHEHSGGLAIRDGSHRTTALAQGRPIAVPTRPGDAVLWFLTTTHSGYAVRPRVAPRLLLPFGLLRVLTVRGDTFAPPERLFLPLDGEDRLAAFLTFGKDDAHLERYLRYLRHRQYAVRTWQASTYTDEVRERVETSGLRLMDLGPLVRDIDASTLSAGHLELGEDG